jgi:hypothetical protein
LTVAPLLILGCGFTGVEVARRAIAVGCPVVGTVRQRLDIELLGARLHIAPVLTGELVRRVAVPGGRVLVAFPPDGHTDAEIVRELSVAGRIVYLSTTGVFGAVRGRVDESTPVDRSDSRAALRLEAERMYLEQGATVVRAAGIYGPGRGLHIRLERGDFRIPGNGTNIVSRIHVGDLAALLLALLALPNHAARGQVFVAADDTPVPQIEAIRWLCGRMGLPLPPSVPVDEVATTLRHDRAVDNTRIKQATSLALEFPSYREGFEACLTRGTLSPRGLGVLPE